jgi:hypothetical protein
MNPENAYVILGSERRHSLPLYEKARIEVYLPDLDRPAYLAFLVELEQEFTYAFGGSSLVAGSKETIYPEPVS